LPVCRESGLALCGRSDTANAELDGRDASVSGHNVRREEKFERNMANAWISFYAEAAHNPRFARLQRLFYRRLRSNLGSALSPLLSRAEIDHFARGAAVIPMATSPISKRGGYTSSIRNECLAHRWCRS
jgi:hypothetical protein